MKFHFKLHIWEHHNHPQCINLWVWTQVVISLVNDYSIRLMVPPISLIGLEGIE